MKTWKLKTIALLSALGMGSMGTLQAQNKGRTITETYKVAGNCGMCKKTIETAASKKSAKATWDENKKELKVVYDPAKTNSEEILKNVAYAGYDNEKYLAPEAAYLKLPDCCQYVRTNKAVKSPAGSKNDKEQLADTQQQKNALEPVYANYFSLKDALVKTDAGAASAKAKALLSSLNAVNMSALGSTEHTAFMNYLADLKTDAGHIAESKDIGHQREHFTSLSQNLYELMKSAKPGYTVYLDHCPMFNDGKGANWISKESAIKNPYYGSQMMTCGKIVETLK
jgi:hypothetical protein